MKLITPPKLIPPFHNTAANGTLPIEQTKLAIATNGPIRGPHSLASSGWSTRKKPCQNAFGTHAPIAPAISRPIAMSRITAAHSMTKMWLTAVNPRPEVSRRNSEPSSSTDMSIAAWPSIDPARPRLACSSAASTVGLRRNARKSSATTPIMIAPPRYSPTANCQPISSTRMIPSSITRFVEATWNAIAAVKSAPLRNSDRASATAAYEHDELAAPRPADTASVRRRASPSSRVMVCRRTTACTAADSMNPRISAQRISQVIDSANPNARPIAARTDMTLPLSLDASVSAVNALLGRTYTPPG